MFQICVIALVGLPSSGKTSFCRTVLRSAVDINILHVCYDEIFTFVPQENDKTFKQERGIVLQHIERIITFINSKKRPFEGVSDWKQSNCNVFAILCDDNHYYSGMRYDLYKICRKHCVSFGQIYFPLTLDTALSRNSRRSLGALPPDVVHRMSERLEAPTTKNEWERNSLTIIDQVDTSAFLSFINTCLQSPLKPLPTLEKRCEKDVNVIHELDLYLRRRIKENLQNEGGDLGVRAKLLNERRKAILHETKKEPKGDVDIDYLTKKLFSE